MITCSMSLCSNPDTSSWALLITRLQRGLDPDAESQIRMVVRNGLALILSRRVPRDIDLEGLTDAVLDSAIEAVRNGELRTPTDFPALVRRVALHYDAIERFKKEPAPPPVDSAREAELATFLGNMGAKQRQAVRSYFEGKRPQHIARHSGLAVPDVMAAVGQVRQFWAEAARNAIRIDCPGDASIECRPAV